MNDEFRKGLNKLKNDTNEKFCIFKNGDCSGDIIKAHSIQNNRILRKISENGEVLYFDFEIKEYGVGLKFSECGRKKATTFTGFCNYHDMNIFQPIEIKDYNINDKEQEFLFAYRALAKEYHAKNHANKMVETFFKMFKHNNIKDINKYFPSMVNKDDKSREHILKMFESSLKGHKLALLRLNSFINIMNINLENKKFWKIKTDVIELNEEFELALSSNFFIEKDLIGNIINDLKNDKSKVYPTFLSVFPQNSKTYILISYFNSDKNIFKFIKEQILTQNIDKQKIIISNLISIYVENITISPKKWDNMETQQKSNFEKLFDRTILIKPYKLLFNENLNIFI